MALEPLSGRPDEDDAGLDKWDRKWKSDPLVPFGCVVTAGVLMGGLRSFMQGNSQKSQKFMRARVAAQALTVSFLAGAAAYRSIFTEKEPRVDPNYQIAGLDEGYIMNGAEERVAGGGIRGDSVR